MTRRRTFLEALAGASAYPVVSDAGEEFDNLDKYREMFVESEGTKETHPTTSGLKAWAAFESGPLEIKDIQVEGAVEVMFTGYELGLQFTGTQEDLEAKSTAWLSLEDARELRDVLDETISMAEARDDA